MSKVDKAIKSVEAWVYSINWREGDPKPFKYKDSEAVMYDHHEIILQALKYYKKTGKSK